MRLVADRRLLPIPSSVGIRVEGSTQEFAQYSFWVEGNGFLLGCDADNGGRHLESSNEIRYLTGDAIRDEVVKVRCRSRTSSSETEIPPGGEISLFVSSTRHFVSPTITSLLKGGAETFRVSILGGEPPSNYRFRFSLKHGLGTLHCEPEIGTSPEVRFEAGKQFGTDILICELFAVSDDGGPVPLGIATAEILIEWRNTIFDAAFEVLPTPNQVTGVVRAPMVHGAKHYELVATGGFDPEFYHHRIELEHWQTTVFYDIWGGLLAQIPQNELWACIAAYRGDVTSRNIMRLNQRFANDWSWKVRVTF